MVRPRGGGLLGRDLAGGDRRERAMCVVLLGVATESTKALKLERENTNAS